MSRLRILYMNTYNQTIHTYTRETLLSHTPPPPTQPTYIHTYTHTYIPSYIHSCSHDQNAQF